MVYQEAKGGDLLARCVAMDRKNKPKGSSKGYILAACPQCKGEGKVPRNIPLLANPRAPLTRADRYGTETCPKCKGTGVVGVGVD